MGYQMTLLTVLDYCNIIRNMSLHDARRTNFVLSELLIWIKYLQCTLQEMYEVAGDLDYEKETFKVAHIDALKEAVTPGHYRRIEGSGHFSTALRRDR